MTNRYQRRTPHAYPLSSPLKQELQAIFGSRMSDDRALLGKYCPMVIGISGRIPDFVVWPRSASEVQQVAVLANNRKVPLVPVAAGTNAWGLQVPLRGGIVVDLSRMKRVLRIDASRRFCVIEPGVMTDELFRELESRGFETSIPKSAQGTLIGNVLIHGVGHQPYRCGVQSELINGLEVVLPSGKLVRVGSCAFNDQWMSRSPLPDLCGLFIGWNGTTGIVTKAGIVIYKKPRCRDVFSAVARLNDASFEFVMDLLDLEVIDELACYNWGHHYISPSQLKRRDPRVESFFFYASVSSQVKQLNESKIHAMKNLIAAHRKRGLDVEEVRMTKTEKEEYLTVPLKMVERIEKQHQERNLGAAAGVINPSAYMPILNWAHGVSRIKKILLNHNIPLTGAFTLHALRGSRFGRFTTEIPYALHEGESALSTGVLGIQAVVEEVVGVYLDLDGLVWKAPDWVWKKHYARGDRAFRDMVVAIKRFLDPNNIMHPGQLGIEGTIP